MELTWRNTGVGCYCGLFQGGGGNGSLEDKEKFPGHGIGEQRTVQERRAE